MALSAERRARSMVRAMTLPISYRGKIQMRNSRTPAFAAVVALLAVLSVASAASAGPRAKNTAAKTAACTVSGNVVEATGLPEGVVLNFMVSDAAGTSGWGLGYTFDGTGMWSVTVPDRTGPTTYEFAEHDLRQGRQQVLRLRQLLGLLAGERREARVTGPLSSYLGTHAYVTVDQDRARDRARREVGRRVPSRRRSHRCPRWGRRCRR